MINFLNQNASEAKLCSLKKYFRELPLWRSPLILEISRMQCSKGWDVCHIAMILQAAVTWKINKDRRQKLRICFFLKTSRVLGQQNTTNPHVGGETHLPNPPPRGVATYYLLLLLLQMFACMQLHKIIS